ncbi:MAG: hypothetical protein K2X35_12025 [Bryobacteraceae bacterium]|nr:hypothetical protein [Bryobacteraceae bacterium]
MLVFPQLREGAAGQFPLEKVVRRRAVTHESPEGFRSSYRDGDFAEIEWELPLRGLTGEEWGAIETLFRSVRGRLKTFTFLDPLGNLLSSSEDFASAYWTRDPLSQVTAGLSDAIGGTAASRITNTGQAAQGIRQRLAAPAAFHYCFSLFARSDGGSRVWIGCRSGTAENGRWMETSSVWRRCYWSGRAGVSGDEVDFEARLDPGGSVVIWGAQVEAQAEPSAYQRTADRGGVYSQTRFASDSLSMRSARAGEHEARLRLISVSER